MQFIEYCTKSEETEWLYERRMVVSVSIVYLYADGAKWELWLAAAVQHHERGLYHISLAWEKIKIQTLKYVFYWICIAFKPL